MCMSSPPSPTPPPPPAAPPPAPTPVSPDVVQARQQAKAAAARIGRSGTVLTSPQGLLDPANLQKKTLLGQ